MNKQTVELIVYACPTGLLAEQLDAYFDAALARCGPNTAHAYMAHCTLTGFFHDQPAAVGWYTEHLAAALRDHQATRPTPAVRVVGTRFSTKFHGLLLDSPWIKQLSADFARRASASPTRSDAIRLKDWLHLSLAYGFAPEHHQQLVALADQLVDPSAAVAWELRLYERLSNATWKLHGFWVL